jgi:hypothetical protein
VWLNLRCVAIQLRNWRDRTRIRLATGVLPGTHLAIASHLLAARHFGSRHALIW